MTYHPLVEMMERGMKKSHVYRKMCRLLAKGGAGWNFISRMRSMEDFSTSSSISMTNPNTGFVLAEVVGWPFFVYPGGKRSAAEKYARTIRKQWTSICSSPMTSRRSLGCSRWDNWEGSLSCRSIILRTNGREMRYDAIRSWSQACHAFFG